MKTCPYCAEEIQDAAIKCKHCGSDLEAAPAPKKKPSRAAVSGNNWMKMAGSLLILASVVSCVVGFNAGAENTGETTSFLIVFGWPLGLLFYFAGWLRARADWRRAMLEK